MQEDAINKTISRSLSTLTFVFCVSAGCVFAQDKATPAVAAEAPITAEPGFNNLPGLWVRPDGGYLLAIRGVDTHGRLDAAYANPHHVDIPGVARLPARMADKSAKRVERPKDGPQGERSE